MKINSAQVNKLLSRIYPAVPARTPMPILENFLFKIKDNVLTVSATDLELTLKESIPVNEKDLEMVVPAKILFDLIKLLPDTEIEFRFDKKLQITANGAKYNLSIATAEDFPATPEILDCKEILINGTELLRAFNQTSFAVSKEEIRPAMTGTLLEFEDGLSFVTTDGHRLVKYISKSVKLESDEQYIIPSRTVSILSKLLGDVDVKIQLSKSNIVFQIGNLELVTRVIGEKYPNYESVIPLEHESTLRVKNFLPIIKRISLFSQQSKQVRFSISKNKLELSAEDIEHGSSAKESIDCEFTGEPFDIGFNIQYVADMLTHMPEEMIFKLNSPTKAAIIEPVSADDLIMLLMPIRLNN